MSFIKPEIAEQPIRTIDISEADKVSALKHLQKGARHFRQKEDREALKYLIKGCRIDPENDDGLLVLSQLLERMGRRQWALEVLEKAQKINPGKSEIYFRLGELAASLRMFEGALQFFAIYIQMEPNEPAGYTNYSDALLRLERFDEAIDYLQGVIPLMPESPVLWNALAAVVNECQGLEPAWPFYEESLRLDPSQALVHYNVGVSLGHDPASIEYFHKALDLEPRLLVVHSPLAQAYLREGNLADGWKHFEHRLNLGDEQFIIHDHGLPEWQGEDLSDKSILITPEQGIGDEIIFSHCLPDIYAAAKQIFIACDRRLIPLLQRSYPNAIIGSYKDFMSDGTRHRKYDWLEEHPKPDYSINIACLPRFYRNSLQAFPKNPAPHLIPDPAAVDGWKAKFAALGDGPKVGICWRSGMMTHARSGQYPDLKYWRELLQTEGVQFVNIQYGDVSEELEFIQNEFGVKVHDMPGIDLREDIDDLAAFACGLDLVITAVTATQALSGAVGAETWCVKAGPSWWEFGTGKPMFQINGRVFDTDTKTKDWSEPMAEIKSALIGVRDGA